MTPPAWTGRSSGGCFPCRQPNGFASPRARASSRLPRVLRLVAYAELLRTLVRHGVEFIVVGGMAAVLHGAPVHTFDLDIVYSRSEENVARLLGALAELGATFRTDPRSIAPNESHLRSEVHKLLLTKLGPLDVLGATEEATSYEDLIGDTVELEVKNFSFLVLTIERLIDVKSRLDRPKDRAMFARAAGDARRAPPPMSGGQRAPRLK